MTETVLACVWMRQARVGVAYIRMCSSQPTSLHVLAHDHHHAPLTLLDMLQSEWEPSTLTAVLVNNASDDAFIRHLVTRRPTHHHHHHHHLNHRHNPAYDVLLFRPKHEFKRVTALATLHSHLNSTTTTTPTTSDNDDMSHTLHHRLLIHAEMSVCCAGCLIDFIAQDRPLQIHRLHLFSLKHWMFVSSETMHVLQVIPPANTATQHANMHFTHDKTSSPSLLALLTQYVPQLGKNTLRRWIQTPISDLNHLHQRQFAIHTLLNSPNASEGALLVQVCHAMKEMRDIRPLMAQVWRHIGTWSAILKTVNGLAMLYRVLEASLEGDMADPPQLIQTFLQSIDLDKLEEVSRAMTQTIDFDQSILEHQDTRHIDMIHFDPEPDPALDSTPHHEVSPPHKKSKWDHADGTRHTMGRGGQRDGAAKAVIKTGVDEQLDEMKRFYAGLSDFLADIVPHVEQEVRSHLAAAHTTTSPSLTDQIEHIDVVYYPQLGFLVSVHVRLNDQLPQSQVSNRTTSQWTSVPGLEFQFSSSLPSQPSSSGTSAAAPPASSSSALGLSSAGCIGVVHYKCQKVRELDEQVGDVHVEIVDRELEILSELQGQVQNLLAPREFPPLGCVQLMNDTGLGAGTGESEDGSPDGGARADHHHLNDTNELQQQVMDVVVVMEIVQELACLVALARCSFEYQWVRPDLVESGGALRIVNGWHPIQNMVTNVFIPNDTRLGQDSDEEEMNPKVLVITGANGSGKSVYLKQVGLIVYLAHLGCYVPAESAQVPLFKRILTRLQTMESASLDASAFKIDLGQVGEMMDDACARSDESLILMDEFGKGTATSDGIGLLAATMRYLTHTSSQQSTHDDDVDGDAEQAVVTVPKKKQSPYMLIVTHFHQLIQKDLLAGIPCSFGTFQVMLRLRDGQTVMSTDLGHRHVSVDELEDVSYLYQLTPGYSTSSLGVYCAYLNSIDMECIKRAEQVSRLVLLDKRHLGPDYSDKEQKWANECEALLEWFLSESEVDAVSAEMLMHKLDAIGDMY